MPANVVIVDYGAGNLHSVKRSLDRSGIVSTISACASDVKAADKIILPGVGHFGNAISRMRSLGLEDSLNESVLIKQRPILGICLGMQLMARSSEEGNAEGLGWFDAAIVRFDVSNKIKYKVPHIGWNRANVRKPSVLMQGADGGSEFYFVHSYHLRVSNGTDTLCETEYENVFPSAIEKDNIFGVQFHPEKSHEAGARILKNFVEL